MPGYLVYAFGDIFLVVIEILITPQVNNWNKKGKPNELMLHLIKTVCILSISISVILGQPGALAIDGDPIGLEKKDTLQYLNIPERLENAMGGAEFVAQVAGLSQVEREKMVAREILAGNVPSFSRTLKPLKVTEEVDGKRYELLFFATQDYLAIGSDEDYLYIPLTPLTAQSLAKHLDCVLPTKKMVDMIYHQASVKLSPQPIPPSDSMTTVPVFKQHTDSIRQQIGQLGLDRSADGIIAGHKKDIIISNKIFSRDSTAGSVVIYGWHLDDNRPIQPVYNGHHARYADYSHGTRLISKYALLNGDSILVERMLKHPDLSILGSHEGVIPKSYYPESDFLGKKNRK